MSRISELRKVLMGRMGDSDALEKAYLVMTRAFLDEYQNELYEVELDAWQKSPSPTKPFPEDPHLSIYIPVTLYGYKLQFVDHCEAPYIISKSSWHSDNPSEPLPFDEPQFIPPHLRNSQ